MNKFSAKYIKNPETNKVDTIYEHEDLGKIIATNLSVEIMHAKATTFDELDELAKMVSEAWVEHERLRAQVIRSITQ